MAKNSSSKSLGPSLHFATEADLVNHVVNHLPKKGARRRQVNVLREFDSSAGRADMIFFQLRDKWRQHLKYSQLPPRWLYALRILPLRKAFTSAEFSDLTGVSPKTAGQTLRRYANMGFCQKQGRTGPWLKVRQPLPLVKRIVAVEAKLENWKRALSQAYRYQRYANQSWVVLDASKSRAATAAHEKFRRLNVGLRVFYPSGEMSIIVKPKFSKPKSPYHFWEANGIIATSLRSTM